MINHITTDELKLMTGKEGLILQGCGGDPQEWLDGVNDLLTEAGILSDGNKFHDVSVFEHDGLTNILFDMDGVKLDVGKLAMWRIATRETFGGVWFSDYLPNTLGVSADEHIVNGAELSGVSAPPVVASEEQILSYGHYSDDPRENDPVNDAPDYPISVYIENAAHPEYGGFTLPLPATREKIQPQLDGVGIGGEAEAAVKDVLSGTGGLADAVFNRASSKPRLSELNYLAAKIQGLDSSEREVFSAVVASKRHSGKVAELINITENMDNFYLQPAYSAEQYGDFLLQEAKDNTAEAFERLEKSADPLDRELASHILELEANADAKACGRAAAEREGGVFTEYGYLTADKELQDVYRGPEDVPDEYRIFTGTEVPEAQLAARNSAPAAHIKIENVDLPSFLMKMHALAGDVDGARRSLQTLAEGGSDFLLRIQDGTLTLYSADDAYYKFSEVYSLWIKPAEPGVRTFALAFYQRKSNAIGGLYEADPSLVRENIKKYGTMRGITDEELQKRVQHTFSRTEWDSMGQYDRNYDRSAIRAFAEIEVSLLNEHLSEQLKQYASNGRETTPEDFLAALNRDFMERAEYSQPEMLRVPHSAAKELLAEGVSVFHLLPKGPGRMSVMEAVHSKIWSHKDSAVAILRKDISALDKWAYRAAGEITRQLGRGEHNKSQGMEV
jgi:hypothetical protein